MFRKPSPPPIKKDGGEQGGKSIRTIAEVPAR